MACRCTKKKSRFGVGTVMTGAHIANINPTWRDKLTKVLKLDSTKGGLPILHPLRRFGRLARGMGIGTHDFFVLGPLGRKAGGESKSTFAGKPLVSRLPGKGQRVVAMLMKEGYSMKDSWAMVKSGNLPASVRFKLLKKRKTGHK